MWSAFLSWKRSLASQSFTVVETISVEKVKVFVVGVSLLDLLGVFLLQQPSLSPKEC